jgi:hypothetical protein
MQQQPAQVHTGDLANLSSCRDAVIGTPHPALPYDSIESMVQSLNPDQHTSHNLPPAACTTHMRDCCISRGLYSRQPPQRTAPHSTALSTTQAPKNACTRNAPTGEVCCRASDICRSAQKPLICQAASAAETPCAQCSQFRRVRSLTCS